MFSRFRRSKSDKPTHQPKLSGMPALKQMRSSKREESLSTKAKSALPSISDLEHSRVSNGTDISYSAIEEPEQTVMSSTVIPPNYKRPLTPDSGEQRDSRQPNYIDRISHGHSSSIVFCEELSPGITEEIPEEDEEAEDEPAGINTAWRMSKGDSGYKSKDDGNTETMEKKAKKTRNKTNHRKPSATSGLHDIKQQRKASRESISQSMRALTPKERESIQCLEEVLKNHPDGYESFDEVFDSDSSERDMEDEIECSFKKVEMDNAEEETIDYGYASVNDISRKYSIESNESVGSIIDLVGNLSTSPSSQVSPVYAAVDFTKKHRDVIDTAYDDATIPHEEIFSKEHYISKAKCDIPPKVNDFQNSSDDVTIEPEDAITQLDDVINSFNLETDEEKEEEKDELKKERKREKRSKTHKSTESTSDGEREGKKRERKKKRDGEKEKERKERKKKRKEEKAAKKGREKSDMTEEAKRREQYIAKHVDEISALTQDMIKTAQHEEPVYAQVKKHKKKKRLEENAVESNKEDSDDLLSPPSPFSNPVEPHYGVEEKPQAQEASYKMRRERTDSSCPGFMKPVKETPVRSDSPVRRYNVSKANLTSTPIVSPEILSRTSMYEISPEVRPVPVQGPKRPMSDSTQYKYPITPYFSKFQPQSSARMYVSPSMLTDSTRNLRHIDKHSSTGTVMEINPGRSRIKEPQKGAISASVSTNSTPKIHYEKMSDPTKSKPNFYRHSKPEQPNHSRPGRPISLNLDESGNLTSLTEEKIHNVVVKPYSSFRQDRNDLARVSNQGQKPRPFVLTTLNKPIQLY